VDYFGENKLFKNQYLSGDLELELKPQGKLAERVRADDVGILAFYTEAARWWRKASRSNLRGGGVCPRTWLRPDLSIIKAWRADPAGNLMFRKTARNFNLNMATGGKVTVVEVEEIAPDGTFNRNHVHTPGIHVDRIVLSSINEKRIEKRTMRARETA